MAKLVRKYRVLALIALMICSVAGAQNAEIENLGDFLVRAHKAHEDGNQIANTQSISIRYENDKAWPRWDYANNRDAYNSLLNTVSQLTAEGSNVRTIVIEGAASPVGSEEYNYRLALNRAKVLRTIISKMEGGDRLKIHAISAGEDWKTFRSYIEAKYHKENRNEVLAILNTSASNDEKELMLQALDGGKTWRVLVNEFMASARNAAVIRIVEIADLAPKEPPLKFRPLVAPVAPNELFESEREEQIEEQPRVVEPNVPSKPVVQIEERKPVMAFRSNLLVPALNVGVELPIGNHWSLGADYYYPWVWPKRDNKNCFEFLGWGIEARYWFGRNRTAFDRLKGHSLGLYGYMGYYDFEYNFHGHQGEFANIGLDYTYAMAVGKRKQVHFEFSLGVGCIYSQARKYTVIESGAPLISDKITKTIMFFGPTKANISLVVPIFQRVKPQKREGGNE